MYHWLMHWMHAPDTALDLKKIVKKLAKLAPVNTKVGQTCTCDELQTEPMLLQKCSTFLFTSEWGHDIML